MARALEIVGERWTLLIVAVPDTVSEPGPGFDPAERRDDPVTAAIGHPRRLLDPLRI